MRFVAIPWTIGAISLAGELALCGYLLATMRLAYTPGEGAFLLGVIPAVLMLFYSYHLLHLSRLWSRDGLPNVRCGTAVALQVTGGVCGHAGLWLAAAEGPHVAPFFVAWALLLQLVAIWLARFVLASSKLSANDNRGA